jgi:16S rRNA (guanine966-N2)-methyltransferase
MRIIAGKHRGRALRVPRGGELRPTADRVREAVFNILHHHPDWPGFEDAIVFDIFAGTGAYGLEALSRGAALAVVVDRDPEALTGIQWNAASLNEEKSTILLKLDAARRPVPPNTAKAPGTRAFLDPPYHAGLAVPALEALKSREWIDQGAVCVVEVASRETLSSLPGYSLLDERTYGAARVAFLRSD